MPSSSTSETITDQPFLLELPVPRLMTEQEELQLCRSAYERSPDSPAIRYQLASLLVVLDQFDEACTLFGIWKVDEYRFLALEIKARLARGNQADDDEVRRLCRHGLELCENDSERAVLWEAVARVALRAGDVAEGRQCLVQALGLAPGDPEVYRRLSSLEIEHGNLQTIAAYAAGSAISGHSGVIASRVLAQARLGRIEQARETQGAARFLRQSEPAPPPGWASLAEFNHDLAAEMTAHASLRYGRHGFSSRHTWHVPLPHLRRSHVFPALQRLIQREVALYCAGLEGGDHPFLASRPAGGKLQNWCVITEGEGHETWHLHPGWLSGTYYVQVPPHIADGTGAEGCIAFGIPEQMAGEENARQFGEVRVRPRAGLLVLFPSHVYHRTYPHRGVGRRVCCAFDIEPVTPAR